MAVQAMRKANDMLTDKPFNATRDILFNLLKKHSYREGDFTLSSGAKSKYYIDCKPALLTSAGHKAVAELIILALNRANIHAGFYAGVELGGLSLASAMAGFSKDGTIYDGERNALYVRKQAKEHGTGKLVEGWFYSGANVVLLEDVITTGESSIRALGALRAAGLVPVAVVAVVDRNEGGVKRISDVWKVPVISLFDIGDFASKET